MKLLYTILFAFCSASVGFKTSISPSIDIMMPLQKQLDMKYDSHLYKDSFNGFPLWFPSYAISSFSELTINDSKKIKVEIGYKTWSIKQGLIDLKNDYYNDNLKSNYNQLFSILYLLKWRNIDIGIGINSTSMTDNIYFREGSIEGQLCLNSDEGSDCRSDWNQRTNTSGNGYLLSLRSNHKLKNRFYCGYTLKYSNNVFDAERYLYNDDYEIEFGEGKYSYSHIEIGIYIMFELINLIR
mgnify:CR=1 FL=1|tara:strand:- start:2344 stop:3063 length:720 start_codon:yes stop_codon:yes gene_type:complete